MSIIIKNLQDMSRNNRFLISELEKFVWLLLLSEVTNAKDALKCVKTYQQHALMLMHVHKNVLDNINLADVANELVDRKHSRKLIFKYFSHNYS